MKKYFFAYLLSMILMITLFFLLRQPQFDSSEKSSTSLLNASIGAFDKLDARMTLCTSQNFLLENIDETKPIAPLFENMGNHHFKISTRNADAQKFFDQGLKLTYGFNHAEGHRSFMESARIDPDAAMAYWGQAYALGPNINDPVPNAERRIKAYEAIQKAKSQVEKCTVKEQDLINALLSRYSSDTTTELSTLNESYRMAMESVVNKYSNDPEVLTLYAAAVMNTCPWNYWDKQKNPRPHISKAKEALEKAMKINPDHPGAHHYYIHMVELPFPDMGVKSAERLGQLIPASGHLVHMPSHIYIRVGRYEDAAKANIDAVAADEDYISQCYSQGLYPLAYYPHNIHFLWSSASFLGDSKAAIEAAKKTAEKVPVGELTTLPFLQDYASTPLLAYTRFGKWNEILTLPYPGKEIKHIAMIWHYARGIAFLRKNNINEAVEELQALKSMKDDPELANLIANYTNNSQAIAKVAYEVLAGEIELKKGNLTEAVEHLKKGVEFEEELVYSEPAAWHIPVRQTLGSVLLKAGKANEAEQVYLDDLSINRDNGWSLIGLYKSLKNQGKTTDAEKVMDKFDQVWSKADISIDDSIL